MFGVLGKIFKGKIWQGQKKAVCCKRNVKRLFFYNSFYSNWICPQNHWTLLWTGLSLYSRVLGSPKHHFWDPMILRVAIFWVSMLDFWTWMLHDLMVFGLAGFYLDSTLRALMLKKVMKNTWLFTNHLTPQKHPTIKQHVFFKSVICVCCFA